LESGLGQFWPSVVLPSVLKLQRRDGAYELWQQAGQPSGKDDEFYHQAKKELQQALDKEYQPRPA